MSCQADLRKMGGEKTLDVSGNNGDVHIEFVSESF